MSNFEQEPDFFAEPQEGHLESDDDFENLLGILEAGGRVQIVMTGFFIDDETRLMVDLLRDAGAEVIIPSDN